MAQRLTLNSVDPADAYALTREAWASLGLHMTYFFMARRGAIDKFPMILQYISRVKRYRSGVSLGDPKPFVLSMGGIEIGSWATHAEATTVIAHLVLCGGIFTFDTTDRR